MAASDRDSVLSAAWRPGGVIYLVLCLAGLAAGLWPDAIYPSRLNVRPAPLPVLQTLALAQVAFVLLAGPLLAAGERSRGSAYVARTCLASAVYLLVTASFYAAAVVLADATVTDVARTALCVASLMPLGWAAGAWLRGGAGRSGALLVLLLVALGLPAAYYIAIEFLQAVGSAEWLWRLAPATFAWDNAASQGASMLPRPLWAACVWLGVAAGAGLLRVLVKGAGDRER